MKWKSQVFLEFFLSIIFHPLDGISVYSCHLDHHRCHICNHKVKTSSLWFVSYAVLPCPVITIHQQGLLILNKTKPSIPRQSYLPYHRSHSVSLPERNFHCFTILLCLKARKAIYLQSKEKREKFPLLNLSSRWHNLPNILLCKNKIVCRANVCLGKATNQGRWKCFFWQIWFVCKLNFDDSSYLLNLDDYNMLNFDC